jgi:hypothetical protein
MHLEFISKLESIADCFEYLEYVKRNGTRRKFTLRELLDYHFANKNFQQDLYKLCMSENRFEIYNKQHLFNRILRTEYMNRIGRRNLDTLEFMKREINILEDHLNNPNLMPYDIKRYLLCNKDSCNHPISNCMHIIHGKKYRRVHLPYYIACEIINERYNDIIV